MRTAFIGPPIPSAVALSRVRPTPTVLLLAIAALVLTLLIGSSGALAVEPHGSPTPEMVPPSGTESAEAHHLPAPGIASNPNPHSALRGSASGPNTVLGNISVGDTPQTATYDPANGDLYVANFDSDNVTVISGATNQIVATINVTSAPLGATYDPANHDIYVSGNGANNVTVISGSNNSIITNISVGIEPEVPTYDPANGDLYVADNGEDNITIIDGSTNTVLGNVTVGNSPVSVTYVSGNGDLYVANEGSSNLSVVNGTSNQVVAAIFTGGFSEPYPPAYDSANGNLYVPDLDGDGIEVVSTHSNSLLTEIFLQEEPAEESPVQTPPLYDSLDGDIYVGLESTDNLTVISGTTNTIVQNITVANQPTTPVIDPLDGYLYVATDNDSDPYENENLSVVSGVTDVANLAIGAQPDPATFDPANDEVYVPDSYSDNVTVVQAGNSSVPIPITVSSFTATPAVLTLGGSTNLSVRASGGSGALSYVYSGLPSGCATQDAPGLNCTPTVAGSFVLNVTVTDLAGATAKASTSLRVIPSMLGVYLVGFAESGLTSGTSWSVSLNGVTNSSTGSTITFDMQNGSYSFSIGAIDRFPILPLFGYGHRGRCLDLEVHHVRIQRWLFSNGRLQVIEQRVPWAPRK